ncbi:hypothetical protein TeGR_g10074, partial [Tetraparma gracilis]
DLVAAPPDLEMLNASFCGVDDITGEQAVELQDRKMVLHGNPVTQITWAYQNRLKKIPSWLQTLEKVTYVNMGWGCDVKEITGGAFPASLEELNIQNQIAGLRLHPDSFEGLSKLWTLTIETNKLTEDDMHPGLFGDTKLVYLDIQGNPDMLNFDTAALFPGGSRSLQYWNCDSATYVSLGDAFNTEALGDFTFAGIKDCNVVRAGAMTDEVLEICEAQRGDDAVHFCDAMVCKDGACSDCATETSCGGNEYCAWVQLPADGGQIQG